MAKKQQRPTRAKKPGAKRTKARSAESKVAAEPLTRATPDEIVGLNYISPDLRELAVRIDELLPDPENERTHSPKNLAAIEASMRRYGQTRPAVVNSRNRQVVCGNGMLAAAKALGYQFLAVIQEPLTASEQRGLRVADNRTAELAAWDTDLLADTLRNLREDEPEIADELDLESLLPSADEAEAAAKKLPENFEVIVQARNAKEQARIFKTLLEQGLSVRLLTS